MAFALQSRFSHEEIQRKIAAVSWYFRMELVPGVVTPGIVPPTGVYNQAEYLAALQFPADLSGKRILEIGTWDGPLAFELESRGASVLAVDIQDPNKTGFNTAKDIIGSKVEYLRASVYQLPQLISEQFDIVFFMGIYYHLKNPILAFESVAKMAKMGGDVCFSGAQIGGYFENAGGEPVADMDKHEAALRAADEAGIPLTLTYPGNFMDGHNWFIPNGSAIRSWAENAGLTLSVCNSWTFDWRGYAKAGTMIARGQRTRNVFREEHKLVGEEGDYYRF